MPPANMVNPINIKLEECKKILLLYKKTQQKNINKQKSAIISQKRTLGNCIPKEIPLLQK